MLTFADVVRSRSGDDHLGVRAGAAVWTWDQVVRESTIRANYLLSQPRPAGRPRHIGILLDNVPDFVFWVCAAALSGSVIVAANPTRRGAELAGDIRHTDCDLLITSEERWPLVEAAGLAGPSADALPTLIIGTSEYQEALSRFSAAGLPAIEPDPADTLLLLFSSGSTGAPKAVVCSQGRLASLAESLRTRTEIDRDSVTYVCMPLFHGNSLMMNLAPAMHAGATVCLAPRFTASGFSRDVHRYGVTFVNYVGRALSYVLAQPPDPRDATSTLRLAVGTEASASDVRAFAERFGCRVSEGYGMSEGVVRINRTPETPDDALGLPVGGLDLRILDPLTEQECPRAVRGADGRLLNAQEATGQIVAIGAAGAFDGYYRNPGADAERIRGGNFWTGDLGWRDERGFFYFAGRGADWLRVDGENLAAAPIERIIERWDDVTVAAAYAVPDPRTGDQLMVTLQMRPGVSFDPDRLVRHLQEQSDLGTKAWPRFVRVIEELPTTASGKLAKVGLRRQGWHVDDPVYESTGFGTGFSVLDALARDRLEREFAAHGRDVLLPQQGGVARG